MKQLREYLLLVFILSIPFWILGFIFDNTKIISVELPISALQFVCILLAAIIIIKRNGNSISSILKRGFDFNRITSNLWRYSIFILMPLTILLSYFIMQWNGLEPTNKQTPLWNLPFFLLIYGVSGYSEQLGWTAIATDKLLQKYNIIITGLIVGLIWTIWHIIPFIQTHHSPVWIFWQCIYTIVFRVLLTKIYVLNNRSVFATVALHVTYNTAFSMMPYYGSSYNPMYMLLATCIVGIIVFLLPTGPVTKLEIRY
ncbi:MAG TPA: CPBP family intramembrane glutamic endopeptidase [Cyclobacteriaceae bacterium]